MADVSLRRRSWPCRTDDEEAESGSRRPVPAPGAEPGLVARLARSGRGLLEALLVRMCRLVVLPEDELDRATFQAVGGARAEA